MEKERNNSSRNDECIESKKTIFYKLVKEYENR